MTCQKDFMKVFNMMKLNRYTNIRLVNIQKKAFGANRQFAPYLVQNYVTLYLKIHYKDFLKAFYEVHYEAHYVHKCKVSHFSKKNIFLRQAGNFGLIFTETLKYRVGVERDPALTLEEKVPL